MEVIHYNNLEVVKFINSPVSSNAYLVIDRDRRRSIAIDPGSKIQDDIVNFLQKNNLRLDYIILTHEHFDHCWGVNYLLRFFDAKIVCSQACADWIKTPMNYFNKLYYDSDEVYSIDRVDIITEDLGMSLDWNGVSFKFIKAKGHTDKGICINIGSLLFTGDTIIKDTKPLLKKKYGASKNELKDTISYIYTNFAHNTVVLSGHGETFYLRDMEEYYNLYFGNDFTLPNNKC